MQNYETISTIRLSVKRRLHVINIELYQLDSIRMHL